jgi:hypothetical protein
MAEQMFMQVGQNNIELPDFASATQNFLGLLQEVDSSIAERKIGNLRWRVTTLRDDPFFLIGVTPVVRHVRHRSLNDTRTKVEREIITIISSITEKGERNKFLSDAALLKVERIAKMTPRIGESSIYTSNGSGLNLSTTVTVKTLDQLQDLTSPKSVSFGTLTGSLDTISVHNGLEFRVWDDETKRPVRCFLDMRQRRKAMEMLGQRVVVDGMMKADRNGRPISMNVENFDPISEPSQLPTIKEMRGLVPDFTGGRSLKEYFEESD